MRHTLVIERAIPWPQFNEYEGEVRGLLDGHRVSAHVLLIGESWEELRVGSEREVWATFLRYRGVSIVAPGTRAELTADAVVGTVLAVDGERLKVESLLPLDVDLDFVPQSKRPIPHVNVGDRIRVEGQLEIDFDPDDYEDEESP